MIGAEVRVTLSLIAPALLVVFGLAFFGLWYGFRRRAHLLHLAAACLLFALGAASQVLYIPRDTGLNAVVSATLYAVAASLVAQSLLLRAGRPLPWWVYALFCGALVGVLAYFFYIDRNLLARVYLLNGGLGALFCVTALRMRGARSRRRIDRALFAIVLVFGLHFLPRTLLSLGRRAPEGPLAFADSRFWQLTQLSLAVFSVGLAIALLAAVAADALDDARREGDTDWLTGLLNRRGFDARLAPARAGVPAPATCALVLCDVDDFKRINDVYGHDGGDAVLKDVARALEGATQPGDLLGRIGGEEFAVLLPGAGIDDALARAERLRDAVARQVRTPDGASPVTLSAGVAVAGAEEAWEVLYRRADAQLYAAKRGGKNRVAA
ncbi:GGDEF domain-containing protein [Bordetella genomosp. 5]|uniref:diguanylate cyclase n=1 Tax=Bordetella genomosp. 5 TaxID=1395608 RepID=A0A261TUX1_9BORD|nr:GGDEF domain-containing protein [Bordetella genomosp. 5]OZI52810.1 hypothetical protein CAL25_08685 [Bordetella genomosp. 5]